MEKPADSPLKIGRLIAIGLGLLPLVAAGVALFITVEMYSSAGGFYFIGLIAFIPLLIIAALISTIMTLVNMGFARPFYVAYSILLGISVVEVLGLYVLLNSRGADGNMMTPDGMGVDQLKEVISFLILPVGVAWLVSLGLYRRAKKSLPPEEPLAEVLE